MLYTPMITQKKRRWHLNFKHFGNKSVFITQLSQWYSIVGVGDRYWNGVFYLTVCRQRRKRHKIVIMTVLLPYSAIVASTKYDVNVSAIVTIFGYYAIQRSETILMGYGTRRPEKYSFMRLNAMCVECRRSTLVA